MPITIIWIQGLITTKKIVTTRTYEDRLQTLKQVRRAGLSVCCGCILGLGESIEDRIQFIEQLSKLEAPPESIPINVLVPIKKYSVRK